ncbi:MAG TPA: twin-arginine translocase TatA/TatE family subunit [Phycisphaerae bacterium]|jgi:sec-independent protein translocase protein TatA
MTAQPLALFHLPGGVELVVIIVIGLLIFGRRLPEIGRSLGRSIVEFKKGVRDIEHDADEAANRPSEPAGSTKSLPPSEKP